MGELPEALKVSLIPVLSDNYVFVIERGQQAAVVDPAVADPVIAALEAKGLELTAILHTHHHSDHIGGTPGLLKRWPQARVIASAAGGMDNGFAGYTVHSLALKNDGTVVAWGSNNYGQTNVPAGLTGVIAVAAGHRHSLALKSNGTVVVWGDNSQGQTNVPAGLAGVTAIAASGDHSLVLKPTAP